MPEKTKNCPDCSRSNQAAELEQQAWQETKPRPHSFSLSSLQFPGRRTISRRQIEIQKYLHLCIRNIREEQTALAGWNHSRNKKVAC